MPSTSSGRRRPRLATAARRAPRRKKATRTREATRTRRTARLRVASPLDSVRGSETRRSRAFPARWLWRSTAWCCAIARRRSKTTRAAARCVRSCWGGRSHHSRRPYISDALFRGVCKSENTYVSIAAFKILDLLHTRARRARRYSASAAALLDGGAVGDGGVAQDGDDARADVHAVLLVDEILDAGGVGDGAVLPDARVLVDDGVGDDGALADAHGHAALGDHLRLLLVRLVVVGADDHGVLDRAPLANLRAQAHDGVLHRAVGERAAVRDDGVLDVALLDLRGGQEAGGGVDGRARVVKLKLRRVLGQVQVRLEKRLDRPDVLPVVVEQVRLHLEPVRGSLGNDLAAEVVVLGVILVQEVHERVLLEHVDAHGGNVRVRRRGFGVQAEHGGVHLHRLEGVARGLLGKLDDAAGVVDLHQAEVRGALIVHGQAADGDVRVHLPVAVDKRHVVHAVQVVAGEDDNVLHVLVLDVLKQPAVLAHGVRGALEPLLAAEAGGLRRREHLHEAVAAVHDAVAEVVRAREVAVERHRVELRQDVHLADARVEAVGHGHVDEAVRAADGHRGLGTLLGEGVEAGARTAAEDHRGDGLGVGDGGGGLRLLHGHARGLDGAGHHRAGRGDARGAELGAREEVLAAHGGAAARGRALREHGGGHVLGGWVVCV
mmetsp:Transcript_5893/g.23872  ORF Transcript_5893/g.23872 Transcript_5893/m.23872 type:complete len:664 (-) Transcript_5893:98-2089(-)